MTILIITLLLIFLCIVIVMLIMIQRTSGGMGSALGGGAADQVLGAGSAAQLTKMTVWGILGFFIFSFVLYALYQGEASDRSSPVRAQSPELNSDPDSSPPNGIGIPNPDLSDLPQAPPSPAQSIPAAPPVEPVDDQAQPIQPEAQPAAPLQLSPPAPEANSSQ